MAGKARVVIDTNVLVSALINASGPPGQILDLLLSGTIELLVDDRILAEYQDVLNRDKLGFDRDDVHRLLVFIRITSEQVSAQPVKKILPDAGDQPFLEVSRAGKSDFLITGNIRHFPGIKEAISPKDFLERFRR
ncbi:MAG: putative toxin-antitoxin system toxin component, PIN family [Cyanobacteria bacterium HKST-UBA02]|nr:putative toxin-antitoxin system toxin component, PIN family [Cyanobacteria bacterium HKST-UBA02]